LRSGCRAGETVGMKIDVDRVLLFDADSQVRL